MSEYHELEGISLCSNNKENTTLKKSPSHSQKLSPTPLLDPIQKLNELLTNSMPNSITNVNLTNSNINFFPTHLLLFINLNKLFIDHNNISIFPSDFGIFSNLQFFSIESNRISAIPSDFAKHFPALLYLNLSDNLLSGFDTSICLLSKLQFLHISKNLFTSIPVEFANFSQLIEVKLD